MVLLELLVAVAAVAVAVVFAERVYDWLQGE